MVRLPAGVTKVCVAVFAVERPSVTVPLIVVFTTPANTTEGNDGGVAPPLLRYLTAGAPASVAVIVSVPDVGVAVAVAPVPPPDDEHAPTAAASAMAPARPASFLMIPLRRGYNVLSMTRCSMPPELRDRLISRRYQVV